MTAPPPLPFPFGHPDEESNAPLPPLDQAQAPAEDSFCFEAENIFAAEMTFGYPFRQFLEFARRVTKHIPLAVSKSGLSTAFCSTSRHITANAIFRREDLSIFRVDPDRVNLPAVDGGEFNHVVNIDVGELFDQLRPISKRDGFRMRQRVPPPGTTATLEIQLFSIDRPRRPAITSITTRPYTPVVYRVDEPKRRRTFDPNATVPLSLFCGSLTRFLRWRSGSVTLRVYPDFAAIVGSAGATAPNERAVVVFGSPPNADIEAEHFSVSLSHVTMTPLAKTACFNSEGVARIYCSSDGIARIEMAIGCCGAARVYFKDSQAPPRGRRNAGGDQSLSSHAVKSSD